MLRVVNTYDILTLTLIGCLLLVTLSKVLFTKRFVDFSKLLFSSRYINHYAKEQRFVDVFEALLFLNFSLNIGLLLYIILNYYNTIQQIDLFKYSLFIALFLIIKVLFEKVIATLLNIDTLIDTYVFQKLTYRNFSGLLLIPINTLLIYSVLPNPTILLVVITILFIILTIGVIQFIKTNLNLFKKNLFYFILYLCTLEIAPYAVIYQFITYY
ncbi:DUF4271 domain-containing protein [Olleya sp. ITB9]|uniref:DUF4271 domain-containing protein n=1 Tax=Olleya sp. ITB9 TaxID=1715648 RepID=UPI0006CF5549|nr:DUF4271 domain-containing protein [Olleya sp. ITB9]